MVFTFSFCSSVHLNYSFSFFLLLAAYKPIWISECIPAGLVTLDLLLRPITGPTLSGFSLFSCVSVCMWITFIIRFQVYVSWHFCRANQNPRRRHGFGFGQTGWNSHCVFLCLGDAALSVATPGQSAERRIQDPLLYLKSSALTGLSYGEHSSCCHKRSYTFMLHFGG